MDRLIINQVTRFEVISAIQNQVYSGEQLDYLPAMMGGAETVVINDLDWQVRLIAQPITSFAILIRVSMKMWHLIKRWGCGLSSARILEY